MQHFVADDGAKIAFRGEGEGLPLLCLAGLTRNMADFDYVAPHLSGVRMIRMDYRGRGASDFTGQDSYTVPRESRDALNLLDHLGIDRAAILGTSRGGLNGLFMAATARDRMIGLCLNDVGPVIERDGLHKIFDYVGRNPAARTHAELAERLPDLMTGFANVPEGRWLQDVRNHYEETPEGLRIRYDPALRQAFLAAFEGEAPDLWPLWSATDGMPVALIRGGNSDLLSTETADRMGRMRPDMIMADLPDRAHVPWLDEPEALTVLNAWIDACMRR
ncbi:alpha/beta hydrolase [Paracoccus sp. 1_MG-2023]|uniref:alpha/beta fold hydrolase n=1 Tax=unclassified Paracoccus (in: a-proteobacteria) TaxID=2688777 RepID=UPI001C0870A4|nr:MULTISPECIES: alpha/beta hydrolase [unclassified Paracoccus (in: a-proteobacteria)]MBU2958190.1 alpha/beta hydrolase [Paracoccus sp. C2R09]MDO6668317.1 alpha/beta hydrolase [Paracoccus sp. 1_MG-2023]